MSFTSGGYRAVRLPGQAIRAVEPLYYSRVSAQYSDQSYPGNARACPGLEPPICFTSVWTMILNLAQAQSRFSVPLHGNVFLFVRGNNVCHGSSKGGLPPHTKVGQLADENHYKYTQIHFHKGLANSRVVDSMEGVDQLPSSSRQNML